jgi:hypothetical protein
VVVEPEEVEPQQQQEAEEEEAEAAEEEEEEEEEEDGDDDEEEQEELLGAVVSCVDSPEQGKGLRPTVASSRTPQRTPSSRKQLAFALGGTLRRWTRL